MLGAATPTESVQLPPAGMVPPESEKENLFAAITAVPPQLLLSEPPEATAICPGVLGKLSENDTPVTATALGLESVTLRSAVPFTTTWLGVKLFARVGAGRSVAVRVALAALR